MTKKEYHIAVEEWSDSLYRYALKLCKNTEAAADLIQDAFEKVWIKRAEIDGKKVKAYLFRTVHNKYIDGTRKKRMLHIDEADKQPYTQIQQPDLKKILDDALNQLKPIQKSAVLLRDYEGYNYKEISDILDLSESQVKVYIFRARKQLQEIIGKLEAVI